VGVWLAEGVAVAGGGMMLGRQSPLQSPNSTAEKS
jgi:hypothetical protein